MDALNLLLAPDTDEAQSQLQIEAAAELAALADRLAAAEQKVATYESLLYEFQNNPNIELGEIGQEKIEAALQEQKP